MKNSMVFKVLAFILATVCLIGVIGNGVGILLLASEEMYTQDFDTVKQDLLYSYGYFDAYTAARYYASVVNGFMSKEHYEKLYTERDYSGMVLNVYKDEKIVYTVGSLDENATTTQVNYTLSVEYPYFVCRSEEVPTGSYSNVLEDHSNGTLYYYVFNYRTATLDVTATLDESLLDTEYQYLLELYNYRYTLIWALAGFLLLSILLVVYLLCTAGRDREGLVNPVGLSRMPLDVYCFGALCILLLLTAILDTTSTGTVVLVALLILIAAAVCIPVGLGFLYILAAQIKCKGGYWWKHTICGWCLQKIWCLCRRCVDGLRSIFELLPVVWQWLLTAGIMAFALLFTALLTFGSSYIRISIFFPLLLLAIAACIAVILYGSWCFGMILIGAKKMSDGELDYRIPEEKLFGAFKTCAQQLNSLSGAAAIAAEKQLRSERMKTELITNVSHDIKTPLTSIINFVDLLEKPHTEEESTQYLEVLSRQSQSLKKLIEDLMDLSKASTGNMNVNLTTLDAVEAVNQALGEYADKLEKAQLAPIVRAPEGKLPITADGRLIWRVLSNLLGNAVKYAAPGTRVYLEVTDVQSAVQISIRNISRDELTVTAEELLERFVQGDASRNTEGSGLGLNIAKSLMEVQHGTLDLTLDGDLFKVTLTFPKA